MPGRGVPPAKAIPQDAVSESWTFLPIKLSNRASPLITCTGPPAGNQMELCTIPVCIMGGGSPRARTPRAWGGPGRRWARRKNDRLLQQRRRDVEAREGRDGAVDAEVVVVDEQEIAS